MENLIFDGEQDMTNEQLVAQDGMDSNEEGFMQGYSQDEEVIECAECGGAVGEEKNIIKEIDGEKLNFCSETCAKEYEESLGN
jgi:hypothetical protein